MRSGHLYSFWAGVVKDGEAPFSLNYMFVWKITNIWGLMLSLVVCYLQVLWN